MTSNGKRVDSTPNVTCRLAAPRPRLCHLHAWPDYAGFGFNVTARKGFVGQYVHQVEPGSPAAAAGLRNGDRIVEVNGTNVARENHKQIVERIRAVDGETVLLVVDQEADKFFKDRKLVISGNMEDIEMCEAPSTNPLSNKTDSCVADNTSHNGSVPRHLSNTVEKNNNSPTVNGNGTGSREFSLRLCHVVQWPSYDGYGFMVHTLKDLPGQYVGQIEENSPAQKAGLKQGDRIIEVNGVNVEGDFHKELRAKIQSVVGQVRLLVVDAPSDKYFHDQQMTLSNAQPFVERIACPLPPRATKRNVNSGDPKTGLSADVIEACPHRLRICHLKLPGQQRSAANDESCGGSLSGGASYGFTLRTSSADDGRPGQFVGDVERGSIAERAGLRRGDRIVEVNGFNVETESHREVIQRIIAISGQTKLTVVDHETDKWFQEREVPMVYGLPEKLITRCPTPNDEIHRDSEYNQKSTDGSDSNCNDRIDSADVEIRSTSDLEALQSAVHQSQTNTAPPDPDQLPTHPHRLRLCNIVLGAVPRSPTAGRSPSPSSASPNDVQGYGFNVHTERYRVGHYVGSVDSSSTAEKAGLRPGDRIVEVDSVNVETDSHDELSARISAARARRRQEHDDGRLQLLVVDQDADAYFKEHGMKLANDQPHVERLGFEDGVAVPTEPPSVQSTPGRLRLCQLRHWSDFDGYGFVLVETKSRPGSFVSRVESDSPAEAGGLRPGDRVVEVNGINVETESHPTVADRIRAVDGSLELLVVDERSDKYFADHNVSPLDRHQPYVDRVICPRQRHSPPDANSSSTSISPPANCSHSTTHCTQAEIATTPHDDRRHQFRLCQLRTSPDFVGYGFDVVTERRRPTLEHYIGKVDAGSPAEVAGLRDGDLIVEVNGAAVVESSRCSHDDLAAKIKATSGRVDILVVDPTTERWYRERGLSLIDGRLEVEEPIERGEKAAIDVTSQDNVAAITPSSPSIVDPGSSLPVDDVIDHSSHPEHRLRLCKLRRWSNYSGYGFNLHVFGPTHQHGEANDTSPSSPLVSPDMYVIGAVESGSPAEAGGLRRGDRVLEVNGQKVTIESRNGSDRSPSSPSPIDAVAMIRARPDRVNLLVADQAALRFFEERGINADADLQPFVDVVLCPENKPASRSNGGDSAVPASADKPPAGSSPRNEPIVAAGSDGAHRGDTPPEGPLFTGSAREARLRMPKKANAKNMNISLQEKYAMFEKL